MWFSVCMLSGQMLGIFTVYGCSIHISSEQDLQYQIPWFVQTFAPAISCTMSLFIVESPRWLVLLNRHDTALTALVRLRGLPSHDKYIQDEYQGMTSETEENESNSSWRVVKETLTIRSNLRRLQLTITAYTLAQMSGANSITNYLPTIFGMVGVTGSNVKLYTTGLYALTKLVCCITASLILVDLAGRRRSLMLGVSIQVICHSYLVGYLNIYVHDSSSVTKGASDAAIAMIFLHALGWAMGLYSMPYLFGAELWPNRIRSFGGAISQCFHWAFYFAITKATPSLLSGLDQWGAFVLFAGFCVLAFAYTYFLVPETTGLGLEEINALFERPLYMLGRPLDTR